MHAETPAGQALFDSAKRKGIVPPDAVWSAAERPSWVILALSFVGAQFAIWPFLGFLAMFVKGFSLLEPPASLVLSLLAISGGVWVLRQRGIGLFVAQLAFTVLLIGLAHFAAYTYVAPFFKQSSGFDGPTIGSLLLLYGEPYGG